MVRPDYYFIDIILKYICSHSQGHYCWQVLVLANWDVADWWRKGSHGNFVLSTALLLLSAPVLRFSQHRGCAVSMYRKNA